MDAEIMQKLNDDIHVVREHIQQMNIRIERLVTVVYDLSKLVNYLSIDAVKFKRDLEKRLLKIEDQLGYKNLK